jgi:alanine dehydrogenase
MPLYLREAEVERLLQPRELTNVLEQTFMDLHQKRAAQQPRVRVTLDKYVLHNLPSIHAGLGFAGIKSYCSGPGGVGFVTLLFELSSSQLVAIVESSRLGYLRTGCATALAARYLAPQQPLRLALIGTSSVARGQLEALHAEFGERLEEIRVWSPKGESREEFVHWAAGLDIKVTPAEDLPRAVHGANFVVTASGAVKPVLEAPLLGPSGLLCACGSNSAVKAEVAPETVLHCREWWADSPLQCREEAGDLIQCPEFPWERLQPLDELVTSAPERVSEKSWSFFKSLGVGLEDVAAASLVYHKANELGLGTQV